jgi:intracellular multiplication protein IcmO
MAQKEKNENTFDIFADKLAEITKKHGQGSIMSGNEILDIKRCSTGSLTLDVIMGGGYGLGKIVEAYGPESSGKAQPLDALIMTPSGWKTMGDMVVGAQVLTPYGKVANVTGVFPQGHQPIYELTTKDGRKVEATLDHLWKVAVTKPLKEGEEHLVLSTKEILELTKEDFFGDVRIFIQIAQVNFIKEGKFEVVAEPVWERVISIDGLGTDKICQCISINSEDKLYITDDYVVTHNTTMAITGALISVRTTG